MSLFDELKRRRVFRVTGIYAVVSWIIIQVATSTFPFLMIPDWGVRLVIALFLLGLPVVVVLAWMFEITSEGVKRADTESPQEDLPRGEALWRSRAVLMAGLAVLVLGAGGVAVAGRMLRPAAQAPAPAARPAATDHSLAVLPFVNMSSDPEQEFFSDGLTEELLNALAQLPELRVASRTSAFSFKGKDVAVDSIARSLRVAHVLEGSVRKDGGRIRVTAQLVRADDGFHLWSETYDRELKGVFAIQDEISRAIVDALKLKLAAGRADAPLVRAATDDAEAYSLYLQGRHHWGKRTEVGVRKAIELFERAIARDPDYVRAYAGLADAYLILGNFGWATPAETYPRAEAMARKALALDSTLAEAHTSLAATALWHTKDWDLAEREFRRALELNPNHAFTRYWYSVWLSCMGRATEAIREVEHAQRLDPLAPQIGNGVGDTYYWARQYDRAIQAYRRTLEMEPGFTNGHIRLAGALMITGRFDEAATELGRAAELSGHDYALNFATLYARWGKVEKARQFLARAMAPGRPGHLQPTEVATAYTALGEHDEAIRWLRKGLAEGAPYLGQLRTDPSYDPLRAEPGFQALLRQLKLDR